jgi:hypothetical protein
MVAPRSLIALLIIAGALGAGASAASAADCIALDDFSKGSAGEFPPGWKPRKDSGRAVYSIWEEGGRRFLRGVARRIGIQAGREVAWDLETHPVLAWSWRPVEFPKNSDERRSGTNDSAASVYAVFGTSAASLKSVKYTWSRVVPAGTHLTSSGGNTQVRILRSGAAANGWVEERVNVRDDYRKYFGVKRVPKPSGIAVLTDSDDTASLAQGDYAGFRVCRE